MTDFGVFFFFSQWCQLTKTSFLVTGYISNAHNGLAQKDNTHKIMMIEDTSRARIYGNTMLVENIEEASVS